MAPTTCQQPADCTNPWPSPGFDRGPGAVWHQRNPVTRAGQELHLTPLEFALLAELLRYAGRLVSHRQLIAAGWGPQAGAESAGLRLVVHQLRRKIEEDPAQPRRLHTEVGIGYRLTEGV